MAPRPCDLSLWLGNLGWLTLYRQLFAWIVVANLTVAILASAGACDWASKRRVQFAVANTLVTLLTRNEVRRVCIAKYAKTLKVVSAQYLLKCRYVPGYCTQSWSRL